MSNFWNEKIRELQEVFEGKLFGLAPAVAREHAVKILKETYGDSFRKDAIPSNLHDRAGAEERISKEVKRIVWRLINQGK